MCSLCCVRLGLIARRLFAANLPRHTEAIDQHSKSARPERTLKRQQDTTRIRKTIESLFGLRKAIHTQCHRETSRRYIAVWQGVRSKQLEGTEFERRVENLALPIERHFVCQRGVAERQHRNDRCIKQP